MAPSEIELVIRRYAKLDTRGLPIECRPSRAELNGEIPWRAHDSNTGKVLYRTALAAELASIELWQLGGEVQRPYRCTRVSVKGHWHLTRDVPSAGWRERWVAKRQREAHRREECQCSSRSGGNGIPGPTSGVTSGSGGLVAAGGCGSPSTTGNHPDLTWGSGGLGATAYVGGTGGTATCTGL